MRRRGAGLCLVAVILAGSVAQSDARRNATKSERAAILRAVNHYMNPCDAYRTGRCVEIVRVSTVRSSWSAVYIRPARRAYRAEVQSGDASVHRVDGKWRLHQLGNGGGCGVPASVRRDLSLKCY